MLERIGGRTRTRTLDPLIKSQLLQRRGVAGLFTDFELVCG